jgi:hypothetical protein
MQVNGLRYDLHFEQGSKSSGILGRAESRRRPPHVMAVTEGKYAIFVVMNKSSASMRELKPISQSILSQRVFRAVSIICAAMFSSIRSDSLHSRIHIAIVVHSDNSP